MNVAEPSVAVDRGAHRAAVERAVAELGDRVRRDAELGALTTYRVGGRADLLVAVRDRGDLDALSRAVDVSGLPMLAIGRGSNLLVADDGFRGIAVSVLELDATIETDVERAEVVAGAGVLLPVLARRTAAAGLTGFEWAVGVPGTLGGAVRMNAGGHGSDVAATLVAAEVVTLGAGDRPACRWVPGSELGLRFRGSDLGDDDIVLRGRLALRRGDPDRSKRQLDEIVAWRRANQPGGQNAGSVFVNPVPGEVSAGRLIDELGLRGFRIGTAEVSSKHANFIQADEDGRADDVLAVMREVRRRVADATGYVLRSEIRLVGFPSEALG